MPIKTPHPITGQEIFDFFPDSNLTNDELEDTVQTVNYIMKKACIAFDQEKRKHHYLKNLQDIHKYLTKASECMQVYQCPVDDIVKGLPTNQTQDIGLTFDDWVYTQGLINRLEQAARKSTTKALNKKLFGEFFYELHAVLNCIDPNLAWYGRGELTNFEKISHVLLEKMGVQTVPDKESKSKASDVTEETIKGYIKVAKKEYQTNLVRSKRRRGKET